MFRCRSRRRHWSVFEFLVLGAACVVPVAASGSPPPALQAAPPGARFELHSPRRVALVDSILTCFEGQLTEVLNVGWFEQGGGQGVSDSDHYFVQWIYPDFTTEQVVTGVAFISNDAGTVWPSVGVVLMPADAPRYPTATELANLQVTNLPSVADTTVIIADLRAHHIVWSPDQALVVCLQFPEGGTLSDVGIGPGILVDTTLPDPDCDRFTVDGGRSGIWYKNAVNDPLDWGFAVTFSAVSVLPIDWGQVKTLYRAP